MSNSFRTIDEYIGSFDADSQNFLKELRRIIREVVPKETAETISYQMPTYKYHGNIIHFARYKNHVGLYPGSGAIEAFSERLKSFKTSKGSIHLSLDSPLPQKLIQDIVHFNVALLKDKNEPKWDTYRSNWEACYEFMAQIIVKTELTSAFKWGTEVYTYEGKNIISWGGFKNFFSIWFYNGVFLEDPDKVLINASEGKTKSLRQWRFTSVQEMDETKILAYISESIQAVKDGKEIKVQKPKSNNPKGLLKELLVQDSLFEAAFAGLTPGRQKEYIDYIDEAKQEKTKKSRLEKIKPLILSGKGLYDKYKK
ncbi:hypothetical protein G5B30_12505 [Sphingobacterium sp. SGG-5]|uniref:DUF1801 domain-containing protein n=1 Tax=Sphingobacterium sp. SGG-5 TaxID=2710881 RepID=UPI0013EA3A79|nr:DUF1801 domain-containing protein [Sphingobacterium sp. SGG-5]NGM62735.1 hypothetical protein [Sphingobacterium sp. SGG-5]